MQRIEFHESSDEDVFDEGTFPSAFEKDLNAAEASVVISSGYVTPSGVIRMSGALNNLKKRGVTCCAFIEEIEDWHQRTNPNLPESSEIKKFEKAITHLEALGVHVNLRPYWHPKLAIIDGCIFWDGSLNKLSYKKKAERSTRNANARMALLAVKRHKLGDCKVCARMRAAATAEQSAGYLISPNSIAQMLRELRRAAGLTQGELAECAGLSTSTICEIEQGKYIPQFEKLWQIWDVLAYDIVSFPRAGRRLLDPIARLSPLNQEAGSTSKLIR